MRQVKIRNFGPLDHIDLALDKSCNVVIGEQAIGKSTLAKMIYFSLKMRDYLLECLSNPSGVKLKGGQYDWFLRYIRRRFMGCFGTTKHMRPFEISFDYDCSQTGNKGKQLILRLKEKFVHITFSPVMRSEINSLFKRAEELYAQRDSVQLLNVYEDVIQELQASQLIRQHLRQAVNVLFDIQEDILYIPAGRSVLATLSEQLQEIDTTDTSQMDLPLKEFISLIQRLKKRFGMSMEGLVEQYTKLEARHIRKQDVRLAIDTIKKILKAEYIREQDVEKLYYDNENWVKLMYASSGQQESLWILLVLFQRILQQQETFLIVEEPEAHLFPVAQRYMMEMVGLFMYSTKSKAFITTHSPYVLNSLNVLAYAGKVEGKKADIESSVVPRGYRIFPGQLEAYILSRGEGTSFLVSIMDQSEGLIQSHKIDSLSDIIEEDMEKLLEKEVQHDLC